MFKCTVLAIGLLLALASSAAAQNTTCSNRPAGDSSNACANTRFVTSALPAGAALTRTDDTNVTLTLTGTPATALLQAVNVAAGWNGQLSIARGGTSAATQPNAAIAIFPTPTRAGDVAYWNGTIWTTLAGNNSGTNCFSENASGVPAWFACGAGTITSAAYTNSTGMAVTGTTPCTTTCSWTFAVDKATSGNLEAGTSNKVLTADIIYDGQVTITFNATQTLDFNTFLNGVVNMTGNITSLTCSNIKASQSGVITFTQDGTGSRTMVAGWCSQFRWGGGTRGVLSTAANSIDGLFYQCPTTSFCYVNLIKAVAN